jgi:hypothetical protein
MYNFTPMTDEQINSSNIIDAGIYDFEVIKSVRKASKAGNPMAELTINVWDNQGKQHSIFDYLVFSNIALNIKKIKHFCDATGLSKQYERGSLPEQLVRLCGKVEIGIKDEQPNPNGGTYPKKNVVVDYVMTNKGATKANLDDDVPF